MFKEVMVRSERKMKNSHSYMPRAWKWVGGKQVTNESMINVIDMEEEFTFHLYVHTPRGTTLLRLFTERNQEVVLSHQDKLDHLALAMAAVVTLTLFLFK